MTTNIKNKSGFLSAYGFACGYVERKEFDTVHVEMWKEHGVFHVRVHCSDKGRLFWESFDTLGKAKKSFLSLVKHAKEAK